MVSKIQKISKTVSNVRLSLKPRIHPLIQEFLKEEEKIFDLVDTYGSPLNILFPQIIEENITAFQDVYKKHSLNGKIYFTTKPNKSISIIKHASIQNVGVDVASEKALKIAMDSGFDTSRIECTGPKNIKYLKLALKSGVKINVDNFNELEQILQFRQELDIHERTQIFIRLGGFSSPRVKFTSQDSTFGIHVNEVEKIFDILLNNENSLEFLGFSFHFNAQSSDQKIIAIENTLHLTLQAIKHGLKPKGINIGGGFDIIYAENKEEWFNFVETLRSSVLSNDTSLNWNNTGLGFRNEGGVVQGAPNFKPHYIDNTNANDLDAYLKTPIPSFDNSTVADIIKDLLLELYIEPGRALLDQLGITIGAVNFTKKSMQGEQLVGLDMNRHNIHSTNQKLLTDPVIFYKRKKEREIIPNGLYYIGNLCLSYDMITYSKSFPEYLPEQGDLVTFINTAPYIMDFVESETLHQNIAEKIAVTKTKNTFKTVEDKNYIPSSYEKNL